MTGGAKRHKNGCVVFRRTCSDCNQILIERERRLTGHERERTKTEKNRNNATLYTTRRLRREYDFQARIMARPINSGTAFAFFLRHQGQNDRDEKKSKTTLSDSALTLTIHPHGDGSDILRMLPLTAKGRAGSLARPPRSSSPTLKPSPLEMGRMVPTSRPGRFVQVAMGEVAYRRRC